MCRHTPWPRGAAHPDLVIRRACGSSLLALTLASTPGGTLWLPRGHGGRGGGSRQPSGPVWTALFSSCQLSSHAAHFIRSHPTQPRPSCDKHAVNLKAATKRREGNAHITPGTHQGLHPIYSLFKLGLFSIFFLRQCKPSKDVQLYKYQAYKSHLSRSNNKKENGHAQETNFLAEETEISGGGTGWELSCRPRPVHKTRGVSPSFSLKSFARSLH